MCVKTSFFVVSVVLLSFFCIQSVQSKSVIVHFAYQDTSNFPYQTGEGSAIDWSKPGLAVDLLMLVDQKLDIEILFQRLPWKRGLVHLQQGRIDGLFNASFKSERLECGVYPMKEGKLDEHRRSYSNTYVFYKRKDSPLTWDGKVLTHLSRPIGAPFGFSVVDDLKQLGAQVEEVKNTETNFKKLLSGRIDGVATLEAEGDFMLETQGKHYGDIEKVKPAIKVKAYYLMLSYQFVAAHPELSEDIWDMIAIVRESNEFKQLATKYEYGVKSSFDSWWPSKARVK